MNRYPLWLYLVLVITLAVGTLYALPNVFGDDPALQISSTRAGADSALVDRIAALLQQKAISPKSVELSGNSVLVRFNATADRTAAKPAIETEVGPQYVVALNLAPATPAWLRAIGGKPMYMGLDLRGGVHFLMQVDIETVAHQTEERFISELRASLREAKVRYSVINADPRGGILVRFADAEALAGGRDLIYSDFRDLVVKDDEAGAEPNTLYLSITVPYLQQAQEAALDQNLTTLRNRVNELGVAEPVIQRQGNSRIIVELPGVEDTGEAKTILGSTATLEFRMVDVENSVQDAVDGRVPVSSALFQERNGNPVLLNKRVMLTGEYIIDASAGFEQQTGQPAVFITLDGDGARRFSRATRDEIGNPMAVVYIEQVKGRPVQEVINIATIRDQLSKRFQITGLDTIEEARTLAILLRAGSLAAPIEIVEERTVGPSLGQENIDRGLQSTMVAMVAIIIFMAIYYRMFGLIANLALIVNLVLVVALLSLLQATLTLPGIAGIVLTIGMAVDANVLIYERIREEIRNGNTPQASIYAGYEKAFSSIADSNITTLIAGIVLFSFGTGPVRGFAVTLSLGIVTSMFTAIVGSRAVVNLIYGGRRVAKLAI